MRTESRHPFAQRPTEWQTCPLPTVADVEEGETSVSKSMTRRELLRRLGIAGAVAWAAPILTALPAGATPAENPHKLCKGIPGNCDISCACGLCSSDVGDG